MNNIKYIIILFLCVGLWSCNSKKNGTLPFNGFIQNVQNSPVGERNNLVQKYLSKINKTPIIEDDKTVHFIAYLKADSLFIRGDLQNGWATPHKMSVINCGELNLFYKTYEIPSNSQIEYQFVINGETVLDSLNRDIEVNFEFGDRNIFQMPKFVKSPYLDLRQEVKKGSIVSRVLKSKTELFLDRKIYIYLPPNYNKERGYPVMLVYDGDVKLYTTPYKNVLDNLIHDSLIVPIITVFIPAMDRNNEVCEENIDFANYLVNEIIPFIKANYSTYDKPENWGIMGASGGGMISIATGLLYPEYIANIASQSGTIYENWCNDKVLFSTYLTKKEKHPLRSVYIDVGTFDLEFPQANSSLLQEVRKFNRRLDSLGIPYKYFEHNDGHRDSNWNQTIDDILIQFFGK
ncbi:alpha/beta hydrolase-fold protein [Mariniflexile sp.]|uniref:alpha/beta hydrolase-fold protein n=1 Tax=Mariniflexile sp. TaxID=1979402 RepID=UPI004048BCC6